MGAFMPAHVATEARTNLCAGHRSGFPGYSCLGLSGTWIDPSPNHCTGGYAQSPCPSSQHVLLFLRLRSTVLKTAGDGLLAAADADTAATAAADAASTAAAGGGCGGCGANCSC